MKKSIRIIVNGREKPFIGSKISYENVVLYAFGNPGHATITVTYSHGENSKQGSLVAGESIPVIEDMIFNVIATNRA